MLERLANRLAGFLITKGADPENREVYAFALEHIFSTVISYGILIILAAFLNIVPQMLLFFLFWIPIRSNFGGIHAPSQVLCWILSAAFGVGSVLLAIYFIPDTIVIVLCCVTCIFVTFFAAPVTHPNHPVSKERLTYIKKVVRVVIVTECAVIIALYFIFPAWLSSVGMYSVGFAVLFGVLGKLVNKAAVVEGQTEE